MATGTLSPYPKFYAWNVTTGEPLAAGLVYTMSAGGSFPADAIATYTDAALSVANANPIVLNSAGYGVIYLTPGVSYKYTVTDGSGIITPGAISGVIQWTQDGISAVPVGSPAVDVTGTAGENLAAEDSVYLSDGSGGKVAGSWYKTDADFNYASSTAGETGLVLTAVTSGETGAIRKIGQMDYSSALIPGAKYYASATAGALTATPPPYQRYVGQADTANSIVLGPGPFPDIDNTVCDVRLTLTTGVPVTTADVAGATTVYMTPYKGNRIALYNGSTWNVLRFAELTQALGTLTSGLLYDVFAYSTTGVVATEILAWTNGTTRATALTLQDGVLSKTGALTRRYLGTFYTTSTTQTEDSAANRLLYNYYNRFPRPLLKRDATASWTYSTATWRQVRAQATNQVSFVIGWPEEPVVLRANHLANNTSASIVGVGIGLDSTTVPQATQIGGLHSASNAGMYAGVETIPAVGYHYAAWLEVSVAVGTTTWYGTATAAAGAGLAGAEPGIGGVVRA